MALYRTTRARLVALSLVLAAAALVLANVGLYIALTVTQTQAIDAELRGEAVAVRSRLAIAEGSVRYGGDLPHETSGGVALDIAIVGSGGVVMSTPAEPIDNAQMSRLAAPVMASGTAATTEVRDQYGHNRRVFLLPAGTVAERVVIAASTPLTETHAFVNRVLLWVALASGALLTAGGLLVYWLTGRVLRPVHEIAQLADTFSERDLHRRVDIPVPDDELGELVATFNRMLARLEVSFTTLRQFTSDAAHELRAPLAVMASELEVTAARPRSPKEYRALNQLLSREVGHMSTMVDKLLLLARSDAGDLRAAPSKIDVADFVHETGARWRRVAAQRALGIDVDAPDSGTVVADPDLTRRILDNFIDNALKHAPPSSEIWVSAQPSGEGWLFQVADHGPGVPPEERHRVFTRFARVDSVRTRGNNAGAGLGLPLAAAFAGLQGGEVMLRDEPGWGAVFGLWLPATPAAPRVGGRRQVR
jgi:signal transduction histidine kinase